MSTLDVVIPLARAARPARRTACSSCGRRRGRRAVARRRRRSCSRSSAPSCPSARWRRPCGSRAPSAPRSCPPTSPRCRSRSPLDARSAARATRRSPCSRRSSSARHARRPGRRAHRARAQRAPRAARGDRRGPRDRIVVAAAATAHDGFSADDVAWLLATRRERWSALRDQTGAEPARRGKRRTRRATRAHTRSPEPASDAVQGEPWVGGHRPSIGTSRGGTRNGTASGLGVLANCGYAAEAGDESATLPLVSLPRFWG